jgi:hypothetical protein
MDTNPYCHKEVLFHSINVLQGGEEDRMVAEEILEMVKLNVGGVIQTPRLALSRGLLLVGSQVQITGDDTPQKKRQENAQTAQGVLFHVW